MTDELFADASHQPPVLVISCDTCIMRETSACDDCLVSVLCTDPEDEAMVFDFAEQRAVKMLAQAGLVPTLRHRAAS